MRVAQLDTDLGRIIWDIAQLIMVRHRVRMDDQGDCMVDND